MNDQILIPAPSCNPIISALKAGGFYRKQLEDGRHSIACPWSIDHQPDSEVEAIFAEPDGANPCGSFSCEGAHEPPRTTADLIACLGLSPSEARGKPRMRVTAGDGHLVVDASEGLLAADPALFDNAGRIVRIDKRGTADPTIVPLNEHALRMHLSAKADWERPGKGGEWVRFDPPEPVVRALAQNPQRKHLRQLTGLVAQPFYGADGNLVTSPGYDPATGTYAIFDPADYDLGALDKDAAERCFGYLKHQTREFCFETKHDEAAAICAMLTAAVRASLPLAPAFSITATEPGSGKGYLADMIALFATPGLVLKAGYPSSEDEANKATMSYFLTVPAVINFDDMQGHWEPYGAINRMLTSETISGRLLGGLRNATVSTKALILGSGNNIEPKKDLRRRVVTIRMNAKEGSPALRRFVDDPLPHMRKHRARFVSVALTIIEAYRAAGSPPQDVTPIGSFGAWAEKCRNALIWLGLPDPAQSLIDQVAHDPEQMLIARLFKLWSKRFGFKPVMVRELYQEALAAPAFFDVLEQLSLTDGDRVNRHKLGKFLGRVRGRRAGGFSVDSFQGPERLVWELEEH